MISTTYFNRSNERNVMRSGYYLRFSSQRLQKRIQGVKDSSEYFIKKLEPTNPRILDPVYIVTKEFISKTTPPHPCPLPPGERE
jgi:hypothetical protein